MIARLQSSFQAFFAHFPHFPPVAARENRAPLVLPMPGTVILVAMIPTQQQPKLQLVNGPDFREHYANSVQMRVSLWDFYMSFGVINQSSPDTVTIQNFQGIYVSPQQAKALFNVLQQNLSQYESTFGEIKLEPQSGHGTFLQ